MWLVCLKFARESTVSQMSSRILPGQVGQILPLSPMGLQVCGCQIVRKARRFAMIEVISNAPSQSTCLKGPPKRQTSCTSGKMTQSESGAKSCGGSANMAILATPPPPPAFLGGHKMTPTPNAGPSNGPICWDNPPRCVGA